MGYNGPNHCFTCLRRTHLISTIFDLSPYLHASDFLASSNLCIVWQIVNGIQNLWPIRNLTFVSKKINIIFYPIPEIAFPPLGRLTNSEKSKHSKPDRKNICANAVNHRNLLLKLWLAYFKKSWILLFIISVVYLLTTLNPQIV